jgi:hypothetical protein
MPIQDQQQVSVIPVYHQVGRALRVRVRSGLALHDTSGSFPSYEVSSGIRQPNRVRT